MRFTQFYNLAEAAREASDKSESLSLDELKKYVDTKFNSIEHAIGAEGEKAHYNVVPSSTKGQLTIIDVNRGAAVGTITVGGSLISSPVVVGSKVSFAVQTADKVEGMVYDIETMAKIDQFPVSDITPGHEYREVMGRSDDLDDDGLNIDAEKMNEIDGDIHGLDHRLDDIEGRNTPDKVEHNPPKRPAVPPTQLPPNLPTDIDIFDSDK